MISFTKLHEAGVWEGAGLWAWYPPRLNSAVFPAHLLRCLESLPDAQSSGLEAGHIPAGCEGKPFPPHPLVVFGR